MSAPISPSSPINRVRRSRADIDNVRVTIRELLADEHPMTVRQVFYQLVSRGTIDKTEAQYKQTVVRLLAEMRRAGQIPFEWLADNTRWARKPLTYGSLREMLELARETYRRSLWNDQDAHVEVWLEKDALAGVLYDETYIWDVPLMVTRGYSSLSYLYEAAQSLIAVGKPTYLYYFGDWDPSGRDITRSTEAGLREFAQDVDIHFERVAVTERQIHELRLPTRPTKATDSRSKGFAGESVEVDAIPPATLRQLVRGCIHRHLDTELSKRTERVQEQERGRLARIVEDLGAYQ